AITTGCAEACGFHSKMIENLLHIIAKKNLELSEKIQHMSERNTRDKLLSYLFTQAKEAGSRDFSIPFDRQELADYLCVERSAMSNELSKLRREGIIECKKNNFKILRKQV
ncbi:MAG TPA: Crp/Fnr family transcriptional regulator, partial [Clostridiales bacterium]|nr:Crp/Fnr family transcriptional regulator [Clostridiales bacterium]